MSVRPKISVIVTRPEPASSAFAKMLAGRGMTAILSPTLRIELRDLRREILGAAAVAFTSANGVRSYLASGGDTAIRAFAVGEATAAAARAGGFASIRTGSGDATDLARVIVEENPPCLVHIVGRDEAGDLVGALSSRGLSAKRAVGYAAEPVGELAPAACDGLKQGGAWVALFSARSARLFRAATKSSALDDFLAATGAACLSAAVAEAAGEGWRVKAIAERPTAGALIDAIAGAR